MLVEPGSGDIYLITKRTSRPLVYRLAGAEIAKLIESGSEEPLAAKFLGQMRGVPARSNITAADTNDDGSEILIKTYKKLFRIERGGRTFRAMLLGPPDSFVEDPSYIVNGHKVLSSNEYNGESLALVYGGTQYLTIDQRSHEEKPGPMRFYVRRNRDGVDQMYSAHRKYSANFRGFGGFLSVGNITPAQKVRTPATFRDRPYSISVIYRPFCEPKLRRDHPLWITVEELGDSLNFEGLFFRTDQSGTRGKFAYVAWSGLEPPNLDAAGVTIIESEAGLEAGLYHHVTVVRNEEEISLFVASGWNPKLHKQVTEIRSKSVAAKLPKPAGREMWFVGGWPSMDDKELPSALGNMDDLRIYRGALNKEAIHGTFREYYDTFRFRGDGLPDFLRDHPKIVDHLGMGIPLTLERAEIISWVLVLNR